VGAGRRDEEALAETERVEEWWCSGHCKHVPRTWFGIDDKFCDECYQKVFLTKEPGRGWPDDDGPQAPRSKILSDAEAAVSDRHKKNDIPERNFDRIAKCWSALLNIDITPAQVALMMIALKTVREAFSHQADNLIDIVGYTLCLEEIANGHT
jgi:hypothetical protein